MTFEVRADQLTPGMPYTRLQVQETLGVNAIVSAVALGGNGTHKPVGNATNNGTNVLSQNVVT